MTPALKVNWLKKMTIRVSVRKIPLFSTDNGQSDYLHAQVSSWPSSKGFGQRRLETNCKNLFTTWGYLNEVKCVSGFELISYPSLPQPWLRWVFEWFGYFWICCCYCCWRGKTAIICLHFLSFYSCVCLRKRKRVCALCVNVQQVWGNKRIWQKHFFFFHKPCFSLKFNLQVLDESKWVSFYFRMCL